MVSIYPLALFYQSFLGNIAGVAGSNLYNSIGSLLDTFWVGSISLILFLLLQYVIFNRVIKFFASLQKSSETKSINLKKVKPKVKDVKPKKEVKKITDTNDTKISNLLIHRKNMKIFYIYWIKKLMNQPIFQKII